MLWYLANGSLNEYLKSQVELQGHYYSGQTTTLKLAEFSENTGLAIFTQLNLINMDHYQAQDILVIDEAKIDVSINQKQRLLTKIDKVYINKLILNIEQKNNNNNINQLIERVSVKLANDYPELYPAISAKVYAAKNPELDAVKYAENHPKAGPIIEHTKQKKKRGKAQQKIIISVINIKTLELNTIRDGVINSVQKHDVNISDIGGNEGVVTDQVGGELLLHLLNLAKE